MGANCVSVKNKIAQLITKLTQETVKENIKWEILDAPKSLYYKTNKVIPLYLQTEYKGKKLGVYNLQTKHFNEVVFCILDNNEKVIWELLENSSMLFSFTLLNLFNTIKTQVFGINNIMENLFENN